MHYIYKITNLINNKIYIGQTKNEKHRWRQHKSKSKMNKPDMVICQAMKKYGIDNFTYEIIVSCLDLDAANIVEEIIIEQYDSRNSEKGYNISIGGHSTHMSDETKKKISIAHQGKILSKEHKQKLSESHLGKNLSEEHKKNISKSNTGRTLTEETKQKMSNSKQGIVSHRKGKNLSEEHKRKISEAHKNRKGAKSNSQQIGE